MNQIEIFPDYPANLEQALIDDRIDLGLVPVAAIPLLKQWWLVGDYCIGADGAVASVCLFSDVPLHQIDTVLLDYQSRTSVELVKILIREHWKLNVRFVNVSQEFQHEVSGNTAALIIGDRALRQRRVSRFCYDLAEAWMEFTGLPFVFAAWVSNKPLPEDFIKDFNSANAFGVQRIDEVIASIDNADNFDLEEYFRKYISYDLDRNKRQGLQTFLHFLDRRINVST
jgi:chorismate dehydratase